MASWTITIEVEADSREQALDLIAQVGLVTDCYVTDCSPTPDIDHQRQDNAE